MVAVAVAFGETRRKWRKRGTEGFLGVIMVASTTLLCPPYSVCAVKVNDNNVLLDTFNTAEGPLSINYANNFYSGYAPCFIVGDFKGEFETKKLKKDSPY
jgi:hypothetical protein